MHAGVSCNTPATTCAATLFARLALQEVFTSEKPRMSIQGWFHSAQAPDHAELATRSQLQLRAGQDTAHDFAGFAGGPVGGTGRGGPGGAGR